MFRLPFLLLTTAVPALAQAELPDAGAPETPEAPATVDAGAPAPSFTAPPAGVGRHFAFTWDAEGPKRGEADVQLWATPRWGRPDSLAAVDVRAGFVQGLPRNWAAGVFVDATPAISGVLETPDIDGRITVRLQNWQRLCPGFSFGSQAEVGAGLKGISASVLVAGEVWWGPLRLAINLDGATETAWSSSSGTLWGDARLRQTAGLSYTLVNGFSFGLELQNRLAWLKGGYAGDAFLFGPSVAYRGTRFWWSAALLPQVAAIKPEARRGVGDPLELTANERFTLRLSAGLISR